MSGNFPVRNEFSLYSSVPVRPGGSPCLRHVALQTFAKSVSHTYSKSTGKTGPPTKRYGEEQDVAHFRLGSKGEGGAGLALSLGNLPAQSTCPYNAIKKRREGRPLSGTHYHCPSEKHSVSQLLKRNVRLIIFTSICAEV